MLLLHLSAFCALSAAVEVQKMLLAEEQAAHEQHKASSSSTNSCSSVHEALLQLHDSALHQQALLQHAECVLAPAVAAMRALSMQADLQEQQLQADNKRLQVRWCESLRDLQLSWVASSWLWSHCCRCNAMHFAFKTVSRS
jgi:hypothetical protein